MKILRAACKGELDKMYDEKVLARLDEEQGRKRLSSGQVEALISMTVGQQLLRTGYDALRSHAQYAGADRRLNMAIPMAGNAISQLSDKISGEQLITISNNTQGVCITLSADPMDGQVNVSYKHLARIVASALDTCELSCTMTREESKSCPLRRAYECVPGMKLAARQNSKDATRCPYSGLGIEVE